MKTERIILYIFIYGLLIPITVTLIADLAIRISCKYFWGEGLLVGHSGLKLGIWLMSYTFNLTFIYYIFCILFKIIKNYLLKYLTTSIFIIGPIISYNNSSEYDFRITLCYGLLNICFYVLFFGIRFIINRITIKKQYLKVE